MNGRFKLEGHEPVPVDDLIEWAQWMETADRRIAFDELPSGAYVSTVFLGLDHSFGSGSPILFETMVFLGPLDQEQNRYCTWDEAEAGHAEMLARAREAEKI